LLHHDAMHDGGERQSSAIGVKEGYINRIVAQNNGYWMQILCMIHTTTYAMKMHETHKSIHPNLHIP